MIVLSVVRIAGFEVNVVAAEIDGTIAEVGERERLSLGVDVRYLDGEIGFVLGSGLLGHRDSEARDARERDADARED